MVDHKSSAKTDASPRPPSLGRWARLSRRVVLPVTLTVLIAALILTGYSRLAGSPAPMGRPLAWDGSAAYIAGGHTSGSYTTCVVTPETGQRRVVEIPGDSGGLQLEPWFRGTAKISCGRSVLVTTGWQSSLYPYASARPVLIGLAALSVIAWWYGRHRRPR